MRFEKNGNAKWVGVEMEVKSVIDIKIVIFSWSLWSNYNRLELLLLNVIRTLFAMIYIIIIILWYLGNLEF